MSSASSRHEPPQAHNGSAVPPERGAAVSPSPVGDVEDMSVCSWRTLGVDPEWTQDEAWCQEQTYRTNFLNAVKRPTSPELLGVECFDGKAKKVNIAFSDWITLDSKEVKFCLIQLLTNSTCRYADSLRNALAHSYAVEITEKLTEYERSTLG